MLPKVFEHPSKVYPDMFKGMNQLRESIECILETASNTETKDHIMKLLKQQVNDGLGAISIFRNVHESDRLYVHAYCLVMAFYLDHYEDKEGNINEGYNAKAYYQQSLRTSQIFSHL